MPLCATSRHRSNLKCQPETYQNIFLNLGFINFPQEKSKKSVLALPKVSTERNHILVMARWLVFVHLFFGLSGTNLLDFLFAFSIKMVQTVWPLSQDTLFHNDFLILMFLRPMERHW